MRMLRLLAVMACLLYPATGLAQPASTPSDVQVASVVLDGQVLLRVRGISAAPAEFRAAEVRDLVARYDVALATYQLHFSSGATLLDFDNTMEVQ